MATVNQCCPLREIGIEAAVSFAIGVVAGVVPLVDDMWGSGGLVPRGICHFVVGTGGLLPLNPNEGGTVVYSCNPDWPLVTFYILIVAIPLAILLFTVIRLFRVVLGRIRRRLRARSGPEEGDGNDA